MAPDNTLFILWDTSMHTNPILFFCLPPSPPPSRLWLMDHHLHLDSTVNEET